MNDSKYYSDVKDQMSKMPEMSKISEKIKDLQTKCHKLGEDKVSLTIYDCHW